jgi:hypothetical protein
VTPYRVAFVEEASEVLYNAHERAAGHGTWMPWSDLPESKKATVRAAVNELIDWMDTRRF